jgi:hypothetical protein
MAYKVGNTTVINNTGALGAVDGNSLNLATNNNIAAGAETLVVDMVLMGGGSGGGRNIHNAGGSGGLLYRTSQVLPLSTTYAVNIGAGGNRGGIPGFSGNPPPNPGGDTAFGSQFTAYGSVGNSKTSGRTGPEFGQQGFVGASDGGAGVGTPGGQNNTNAGGNGVTGLLTFDGGGGGGGVSGAAGNPGGGAGSTNGTGGTGAANTGGGGGKTVGGFAGSGGSGCAVIRYIGNAATATGGTVTVTGGYVYHRFNTSGNFNTGS